MSYLGIALIVCVGCTILAVRSYVITEHVTVSGYRRYLLTARRGLVDVVVESSYASVPGGDTSVLRLEPMYPGRTVEHRSWPSKYRMDYSAPRTEAWFHYDAGRGRTNYTADVSRESPRVEKVTWHREIRYRYVVFPLWGVVVLSGVPVVLFVRRSLRRRFRSKSGLCVACGYDLRASAECCPECGTRGLRT
jgi:hypothetical protein